MNVSEEEMKLIVDRVVERLHQRKKGECSAVSPLRDSDRRPGIFDTIGEAVAAAKGAFAELGLHTLQDRQRFIDGIRDGFRSQLHSFAQEMENETGLGRAEDKVKKLSLVIEKTPGTEDFRPEVFTGDNGISLIERAPFGVIGTITPITNPVETIVCNAICFLAGGNTAVFNPHPGSKSVCARAIYLLNQAIVANGGPPNVFTAIWEPTIESARELMGHPDVRLVVVTGGQGVVRAAMQSGKRVIAAGAGNPPVVVDETADIPRAARDIVFGASLDNNIICVLEKELIAVDAIADQLKSEMVKNRAYELNSYQIRQLEKVILNDRAPNKEFIGKDASVMLDRIGVNVPKETRLIVAEVTEDHPFVQLEMMMPLLGLVRVKNADEAIEAAVRCEHGFHHTAVMHSRNIENLSKMAKRINTAIFVKNAPSVAGLGSDGEGYTSFTIASATGEGMTTPRTFTRERRCTLKDYFRIV